MASPYLTIGVTSVSLHDQVRQTPAIARKLGFAGMLFPINAGGFDLAELSGTGRREFRHMLSSQDQQLAGLWIEPGPKGFGPGADVDRALDRIETAMETARGLAAPVLCIDAGLLPAVVEPPKPKPKVSSGLAGLILLPDSMSNKEPEPVSSTPPPDPAFVSQIDAVFVELGRRADRLSVPVAFRTELSSYASLDRVLTQADCPWFGVDLDPVAILRDEWDIDAIFSAIGPQIRHVRARDAVKGSAGRTRPAVIGQGNIDWAALLARLDEAGYHGWLTLDPTDLPDRVGGASAGLAHLRRLLPRPS